MLPVSWGVTDSELHRGVEVEVDVVETERGRVIKVLPDRRRCPADTWQTRRDERARRARAPW